MCNDLNLSEFSADYFMDIRHGVRMIDSTTDCRS